MIVALIVLHLQPQIGSNTARTVTRTVIELMIHAAARVTGAFSWHPSAPKTNPTLGKECREVENPARIHAC